MGFFSPQRLQEVLSQLVQTFWNTDSCSLDALSRLFVNCQHEFSWGMERMPHGYL
jgi:hypothetical protein